MSIDIDSTLRKALGQLKSQRDRLNRQIVALEAVVNGGGQRSESSSSGLTGSRRKRRRMSAAARRAVGARMKAYWAKRRARKEKAHAAKKPTVAKK